MIERVSFRVRLKIIIQVIIHDIVFLFLEVREIQTTLDIYLLLINWRLTTRKLITNILSYLQNKRTDIDHLLLILHT